MKNPVTSVKRILKIFLPVPSTAVISELLSEAQSLKTLEQRIDWFERVMVWLRKDSRGSGGHVRFRFLFQLFRQRPEWKVAFVRQVSLLFKESSLLRLFMQTGFAAEHGLIQETGRRILVRILPAVPENSFLEISHRVFQNEDDVEWISKLPDDVLNELAQIFAESAAQELLPIFRHNAREATLVFAAHVADQGLTREFRLRSQNELPSDSKFLKLQREFSEWTEPQKEPLRDTGPILSQIAACKNAIALVYDDMEVSGTSVGLVYRLEVMSATLDRLEKLLLFLDTSRVPSARETHELLSDMIDSAFAGRSVFGHIHQQTHLISRKIAERNGHSGDHYIARTSGEKRELFVSALQGGVIVLLMTLTKTGVLALGFPPLLEAIIVWIIYSSGFLAMQFSHSTLATKLPSFTASRLARLMHGIRHARHLDEFVVEVRTVLKSQLLAFVGNIVALIPLAWALDALVFKTFSQHVLSDHSAHHYIETLHPLLSLAIALGALTGILLWISSLAGGWFENWVVYQRLPQAIAGQRRIRWIFGAETATKLGDWLQSNASGIAANISLGFLFGFVPFLGIILGMPLDSKHVTISTTSITLSMLSVYDQIDFWPVLAVTATGLFFVGLMNLAVSFTLALIVAARASALSPTRFRVLVGLTLRRLFSRKSAVEKEREI
nr:Site-specific recombinase [uncultured organism]